MRTRKLSHLTQAAIGSNGWVRIHCATGSKKNYIIYEWFRLVAPFHRVHLFWKILKDEKLL
jgi:hypothetical protein